MHSDRLPASIYLDSENEGRRRRGAGAFLLSTSALVAISLAVPAHAQELIDEGASETVDGAGGGTQPSPWTIGDDLHVGELSAGSLTITNGGSVSNRVGVIGQQFGSSGTVTVDGAGSTWMNQLGLAVGNEGTGDLVISNGGSVSNEFGIIGLLADSVGAVKVSGTASSWTSRGYLSVGDSGAGSLVINDGGSLSSQGGFIGTKAGSYGAVLVNGANASWTNGGNLSVGFRGTGSLAIASGASVSNLNATIGDKADTVGMVTVYGLGSVWTNSQELSVGVDGTGSLTITNGGEVSASALFVASQAGSVGTVNIGAAASDAATAAGIIDAPTLAFGAGTGRLVFNHTDTGYVFAPSISGAGALDHYAGETILTGTNSYTGLTTVYGGTLVVGDGGTIAGTSSISIAPGTGDVAAMVVRADNGGGAVTTSSNVTGIVVGGRGQGSLAITDGGSVSNSNGFIGFSIGSDGAVTVDGAGSKWALTGLSAGYQGTGSLAITNGGSVSSRGASIGQLAGSTGTVTVADAGSAWTSSGTLSVGNYGTGALNIVSGGSVSIGGAGLGEFAGSVGTITVDGVGSKLTNSGDLTVGGGTVFIEGGEGRLAITNGGNVSNMIAFIGFGSDSIGAVTVDGAGSTWSTTSILLSYVGKSSLAITNGGTVNSVFGGSIGGGYASSTGTVTVDGSGSTWNAGGISLGNTGAGSLTVANDGKVSTQKLVVANPAGSVGTVNIGAAAGNAATGAGIIDVPTLEFGVGTGRLVFNHTDTAYTFAALVSGGGSIDHYAGETILSGANTYTGGTNVNGGVLQLSGIGTLGDSTGLVTIDNGAVLDLGMTTQTQNGGVTLINGTIRNGTLNTSGTFDFQSGTVSADLGGAGSLTKSTGGTVVLSGAASYSGDTYLDAGTLGLAQTNFYSLGGGMIFAADGTTLRKDNATQARLSNSVAITGNLNLGGTGDLELDGVISGGSLTITEGILRLSNTNTYSGGTFVNSGFIVIDGAQALSTGAVTMQDGAIVAVFADGFDIANAFVLNGTSNFQKFGAATTTTLSGAISGSGTLAKDQTGNLVLTNAGNSYSGGTLLRGGTLSIDNSGALGSGTLTTYDGTTFSAGRIDNNAVITLANDLLLQSGTTTIGLNGTSLRGNLTAGLFATSGTDLIVNGVISGAGGFTTSRYGRLFLNGDNTYSGGTTLGSGVVAYLGSDTALGTGTVNLGGDLAGLRNDSGTALTLANAISANGGAFTQFSIGGGSDLTLTGVLSGSGGIYKVGIDTLALTNANNTFAGIVSVNQGTFEVNGGLTDASAIVRVSSVGTLGGSGTIAGTVDVADGGIIAPGNSPGTLTIGNLNLSSGSILNFEFGEPNVIGGLLNDNIVVTNDLVLDGTLNIQSLGGIGVYNALSYGGALTDNGLDLNFGATGYSGVLQTLVPGRVNVIVTSPGTLVQYWDGTDAVGNGAIDGGDGTWSTAATNWTTAAPSTLNANWLGGVGVFAGTAGTVNVANDFSFEGLQFASDGYVLVDAGGSLTLNGPSFISTDVGQATIELGLSGTGSLVKQGSGALVLNAAGTFSGGTEILSGVVLVGDDAALGTGLVALASGSTLGAATSGITLANAITTSGAGNIDQGTGTFTLAGGIDGAGSISTVNTGNLFLTGANTYTGATIINGGSLIVSDGGTLLGTSQISMGENAGDDAVMIVSSANGGGSVSTPGDLFVGIAGTGGLIISDGGSVDASGSYIGIASGSTGTVSVSGIGSSLVHSDILAVGFGGGGALDISGGGQVSNLTAAIGALSGSTGAVTVSGAGSNWTSNGTLTVGLQGTGTLEVSGGGSIASAAGYLGGFSGSVGSALVTGAGSSWLNGGDLFVGTEGAGTITVADGGTVSAGSGTGNVSVALASGSTGSINVGAAAGDPAAGAGFINAASLVFGDGTGTLVFNHTDAGYTFAPDISGAGSLEHYAGMTMLTGTNTYTGATIINGGTLNLVSGQAIGDTSALQLNGGTLVVGTSEQVGSFDVTGGTLAIGFGGNSSNFAVTGISAFGNVTLAGGNVLPSATANSDDYNVVQEYQIIDGAALSGTFDNGESFAAVEGASDLFWKLRYDGAVTGVVMEVRKLVDFSATLPGDASPNNIAVASSLNSSILTGSIEFVSSLSAIQSLAPAQRLTAYDNLGGEAIAGLTNSVFLQSNRFIEILRSRTQQPPAFGAGSAGSSLAWIDNQGNPGSFRTAAPLARGASALAGAPGGVSLWVEGFGADGSFKQTSANYKQDDSVAGLAFGVELAGVDFAVGLAGAISDVETEVASLSSQAEATMYQGAAYATYDNGRTFANASFAYLSGTFDTERSNDLIGTTLGRVDVTDYTLGMALGQRTEVVSNLFFTPRIAGEVHWLTRDGFTETGSDLFALQASGEERTIYSGILEGRLSYRMTTTGGTTFEPFVSIGAQANSGDRRSLSIMRIIGAPEGSGEFTIAAARLPATSAIASLGLNANLSRAINLGVELGGTGGSGYKEGHASVSLEIGF